MYKNTKKALEIILKEEYDKENPLQSFTHLNLGNQLLTVPKGETILYQGDSAEYFYILLSGHTVIMNQISFSTNDIIDYVVAATYSGINGVHQQGFFLYSFCCS